MSAPSTAPRRTVAAIVAAVREGYENRAALETEVAEAFGRAEARLGIYEDVLRDTLADLAA